MTIRNGAIRCLKVALVLAAFALPSFAQTGSETSPRGGRHGHMGKRESVDDRVKHLTKQLNLGEDQQAKVKSILEDQQKQITALREDSSLSREDRHAKFQAIHKNTSQQIRAALNPDQQKKFDELHSKHKGGREGRHGPPGQSDEQ